MELETIKEIIRKNVIIKPINNHEKGGQSCGIYFNSKLSLYSEELDLRIETGRYKSQLKNSELLIKLFEVVLSEFNFEK